MVIESETLFDLSVSGEGLTPPVLAVRVGQNCIDMLGQEIMVYRICGVISSHNNILLSLGSEDRMFLTRDIKDVFVIPNDWGGFDL